jgi:hypothetical protein
MPLSLNLIRECGRSGIDWKDLHIADLYSIIYSIRIDDANQYLDQERQKKMGEKGISSIRKATVEDFDSL